MQDLFRRLLEFTRDGVYRYEFETGRILVANRGLVRIFDMRCEPEELVGRCLRDLMIYTEREGSVRMALEEHGEIHGFEYHFRTLTGQDRWVLHDSFVVDDPVAGRIVEAIVKDVTERKLAEQAIESERAWLEVTLTSIGDAAIATDEEGRVVFMNPVARELTGWTMDGARGRPVEEVFRIVNEHTRNPVESPVSRVLRDGIVVGLANHTVLIRPDGTEVPIDDSGAPIRDHAGRMQGVILVFRDISERKQAEDALRRAEEGRRALLAAIPDLMFRIGVDGKFLDYHASDASRLAAPPDSFMGRHVSESLPPWLASATHGCVLEAVRTGAMQVYEYRLPLPTGEVRDFEARFVAAGGDSAIAIVRDVTEAKTAGRAVAAERERLAVTLRSIGDGVITTDREGRVVLVNRVAEQLTGWTQEEAEGRDLSEVFHIVNEETREPCESPVDRVLATGGVIGLANGTVLVARDGAERAIADSGAPIRDPAGKVIGVVLVFRDQTDQKRLEAEVLRAQKLESIGVLAGGIAHDFNNLLTAIGGNVGLARIDLPAASPPHARLVEAEKALARARDLTQQLLTFSRGGAPVRKASSIAGVILDSVGFALTGSDVRCEMRMPDDLWAVEVDPGQISQVIHNLVINADQAMPDGGVVRVAAENVQVGPDHPFPVNEGRYVRVAVTDTGIGIAKKHLPRIFDPYFTTKQKGSGLGLSISYSIIRKHSGYIFVESELGQGTTFRVYLPASLRKAEPVAAQDAPIHKGRGRVLVMDDEPMIVDVARAMLAHLGYDVEAAGDGEAALDAWRKARLEGRPFSAVLMDLTIPGGMGGIETVRRLREADPSARAVVSSGYSCDPVMSEFRRYGFRGVVSKPYRLEELSAVLHRVIVEEGELV